VSPNINYWHKPDKKCSICPRLTLFRRDNDLRYADWHNAPVESFGSLDARLLVIGLAPGLKGANRTGRPFTGDYAGELLYPTMIKFGFANGNYAAAADDSLKLNDARITNAVRCVPPNNKPIAQEISSCAKFLKLEINKMQKLFIFLCLGHISHKATLRALGLKISQYKFNHGAIHHLEDGRILVNSYHCSRLNTNTGRLSTKMFESIFIDIQNLLKKI